MALQKYEEKLNGKERISVTLESGKRAYVTVNDLLAFVKLNTKPKKVPKKKTTTKKKK